MKRPLPIGVDNFEKMIREGYNFRIYLRKIHCDNKTNMLIYFWMIFGCCDLEDIDGCFIY